MHVNPKGKDDGIHRVYRGDCFLGSNSSLVSIRIYEPSETTATDIGFRIAMEAILDMDKLREVVQGI